MVEGHADVVPESRPPRVRGRRSHRLCTRPTPHDHRLRPCCGDLVSAGGFVCAACCSRGAGSGARCAATNGERSNNKRGAKAVGAHDWIMPGVGRRTPAMTE
jgi:hypothetical protein